MENDLKNPTDLRIVQTADHDHQDHRGFQMPREKSILDLTNAQWAGVKAAQTRRRNNAARRSAERLKALRDITMEREDLLARHKQERDLLDEIEKAANLILDACDGQIKSPLYVCITAPDSGVRNVFVDIGEHPKKAA